MNTAMTPREIEAELLRQETAVQRERGQSGMDDDDATAQYRLIHRVLKNDDLPALPSGFAARVAQQVMDFEERAEFENTAMKITLVVAVFAGAFFALPQLAQAFRDLPKAIDFPVPMLWPAMLALAFAALVDQASKHYRSTR